MNSINVTIQVPREHFLALLDSPVLLSRNDTMGSSRVVTGAVLDPRLLPRRRLNASGIETAEGAPDSHVITHFPTLGLMFDARAPRKVSSLAEAQRVASECDLLGRKGDWVVGEDFETQLIVDRDFHEPAVNKLHFPNMPKQGLIFTNRKTAWSSSNVWFVDLSGGDVCWGHDGNSGFVVPVLRVSASQ